MRTEEYIRTAVEQMRCRQARMAVGKELEQHMEEQREAFEKAGMGKMEAEEAAILEMGDPVSVGIELDRIHRPKMAWGMIGLIGVLGTAGLVFQYLMQNYFSGDAAETFHLGKQLFFMGISFLIMLGVCYWDYSRIAQWAGPIMIGCMGAFFFGMFFGGRMINGSMQWISIGGITFNVRFAMLLLVPLYGALLYSWRGSGYRVLIKAVLWMLPGILMAYWMPSLITVGILFFSFLFLFSLATVQGWFKINRRKVLSAVLAVILGSPLAVLGMVRFFGTGYQKERIFGWMKGLSQSYDVQILRQIQENCRWIGRGTSLELQEMTYLPRYALSYITAYYGIFAAALLIFLIICLIFKLFRISLRQKNGLGKIMGAGCAAVLLLQVLFYLVNNLGFTLIGGSYCPFLSYGGSGMLVTYVLFGLLLSIYRYENVLSEEGFPSLEN